MCNQIPPVYPYLGPSKKDIQILELDANSIN